MMQKGKAHTTRYLGEQVFLNFTLLFTQSVNYNAYFLSYGMEFNFGLMPTHMLEKNQNKNESFIPLGSGSSQPVLYLGRLYVLPVSLRGGSLKF